MATEPDCREPRITATQAFFGSRAATWEDRFPDDGPRYERAIAELAPSVGDVVLDAACGTGRALAPLRAAVGPAGTVLGLDVTPEMLAAAARRGRDLLAQLVLADVSRLPLAQGCVDAVFGAGLLPHLADPVAGLSELARVSRVGARLALFHPIGRVALAQRRGHEPDADDLRTGPHIRAALAASGWRTDLVDDGDDRYLVLAVRS